MVEQVPHPVEKPGDSDDLWDLAAPHPHYDESNEGRGLDVQGGATLLSKRSTYVDCRCPTEQDDEEKTPLLEWQEEGEGNGCERDDDTEDGGWYVFPSRFE